MEEIDMLREAEKSLILHHWDTDGICSATITGMFLARVDQYGISPAVRNPSRIRLASYNVLFHNCVVEHFVISST